MSDVKNAAHLSWDELQKIGFSAASKAIDRAVLAPSSSVASKAEGAADAASGSMSPAAAEADPQDHLYALVRYMDAKAAAAAGAQEQLAALTRSMDERVELRPGSTSGSTAS